VQRESRNQPKQNRADLCGSDAVNQAKELIDKAQTCFFCTAESVAGSGGARPMSVQEVDDAGQLWFLTADDSHKNQELERDQERDALFSRLGAFRFSHTARQGEHLAR
jgi:general stress protein 26